MRKSCKFEVRSIKDMIQSGEPFDLMMPIPVFLGVTRAMSEIQPVSAYEKLCQLERQPHVRAARKWLKQERKRHYGALCLPLGDDLYLTAKGFTLHTGSRVDILPPIPDAYPLMRLSRRRVGMMTELRNDFERHRERREHAIRNIATQTNMRYVGALEISTSATFASYAAYLLVLPATQVICDTIELYLLHRWRWFHAGPVQKVDPMLARAGCKLGHKATTKQLSKAFFGST